MALLRRKHRLLGLLLTVAGCLYRNGNVPAVVALKQQQRQQQQQQQQQQRHRRLGQDKSASTKAHTAAPTAAPILLLLPPALMPVVASVSPTETALLITTKPSVAPIIDTDVTDDGSVLVLSFNRRVPTTALRDALAVYGQTNVRVVHEPTNSSSTTDSTNNSRFDYELSVGEPFDDLQGLTAFLRSFLNDANLVIESIAWRGDNHSSQSSPSSPKKQQRALLKVAGSVAGLCTLLVLLLLCGIPYLRQRRELQRHWVYNEAKEKTANLEEEEEDDQVVDHHHYHRNSNSNIQIMPKRNDGDDSPEQALHEPATGPTNNDND